MHKRKPRNVVCYAIPKKMVALNEQIIHIQFDFYRIQDANDVEHDASVIDKS